MTIIELVTQHYDSVYRLAYRLVGTVHDAEDLTQQAFLDAQPKLETLRDPNSAKAWICMIARNLFRRKLRDSGPSSTTLETIPEPVCDEPPEPPEPIDSVALQVALNLLTPDYRAVLVLFYFQNMTYQQIAKELNVPVGTVMSRLSRGKRHLRQQLKCDGPE